MDRMPTIKECQFFAGILTIIIILFVVIFGFYTYLQASHILFDQSSPFLPSNVRIKNIEGLDISDAFGLRLPEFVSRQKEKRWWQEQEAVFRRIQNKSDISVGIEDHTGQMRFVSLKLQRFSFADVLRNIGLIYLVSLLFIVSAVSIFRKHQTLSGSLLGFFFLSCSLYVASAAPIVSRSIVLIPNHGQLLLYFNYLASCGLLTLVHFALVFPRPKSFIQKRKNLIPCVIYGYAVIVTVLYFSGIIGFNASYPFMLFWVIIIIGSFTHSIIFEKDIFIRKQITISFMTPLIVTSFFILFHIVPEVLGTSLVRFTEFSLITLLMPVSLSMVMDNLRLYRDKIESERNYFKEKEQVRQDLHDNILNNFANITMLSEMSLNLLQKDIHSVESKLQSIKKHSRSYSSHIRELLYISDDDHNTWEDFGSYLRKIGHDLVKGYDFDLIVSFDMDGANPEKPNFSIKVCLYQTFKEAILNIIKHARATAATTQLTVGNDEIVLEITDDGTGFDLENIRQGCYGLKNMRNRVKTLCGNMAINSAPDQGTCVRISLPF